ncbi:acyltransferase [Desulfosporosinus sp. Sb-LF]|uniref:acyltransferase n=1 Tax=Desulfosporosinus sp. Sb-LF TaxID=2560027 RepID=UPI0013052B07|nr:acyltransferase [Desulfosporosinus sp. Sb-LF]
MSKERVSEWDILRGIAFLAIVLQHSIGQFAYRKDTSLLDAYTLAAIYHLIKFGVPAFVFLTGATLLYNYYGKLNYLEFIRKRSLDVLVPYLVWTPIYYVYIFPQKVINVEWLKEVGKQLLVPTQAYHLWFIILIFQFYLVFPFFLKWLTWANGKNDLYDKKRTLNPVLVFTGLGYIVLMWASYKYLPYHASTYPGIIQFLISYRNSNFLFYSFYFIFGAVITFDLERWRKIIRGYSYWNFVLLVVSYSWVGYELFIGTGYNLPINLNWSTTLKPSMFFLVLSELLALYLIAMKGTQQKNWMTKVISWFGRYSFGAYLVHALILGILISVLDVLQLTHPGMNRHYVLVTFIIFLIVTVISSLTSYILSMIPLGKYLIGSIGAKDKPKNSAHPAGLSSHKV